MVVRFTPTWLVVESSISIIPAFAIVFSTERKGSSHVINDKVNNRVNDLYLLVVPLTPTTKSKPHFPRGVSDKFYQSCVAVV